MYELLRELKIQRWDDHRYYHQNRINQTLHLLSALSFLSAYALVFTSPVAAAMVGWLVAMTSRQIGHFVFEPRTYDELNKATHAYKESIKVGYNLRRKFVLLAIWAMLPAALWLDPTLLGWFDADPLALGYVDRIGLAWLWLGVAALAFRSGQLFLQRGFNASLAWLLKILTDPFHDVKLYYKAPFALLRGEMIDPMTEVRTATSRG